MCHRRDILPGLIVLFGSDSGDRAGHACVYSRRTLQTFACGLGVQEAGEDGAEFVLIAWKGTGPGTSLVAFFPALAEVKWGARLRMSGFFRKLLSRAKSHVHACRVFSENCVRGASADFFLFLVDGLFEGACGEAPIAARICFLLRLHALGRV